MFVGHEAVGLAGRTKTPRISLGTWFLAVQFLDLLWPIFLLLNWEHVRIVPGITKLTPNERVLAWSALIAWIFVPWAWWTDRHRTSS